MAVDDNPNRHSDDDPNHGIWFISEPGHISTLAEYGRTNVLDPIDVDRIYWLGETCRKLLKEVDSLRTKWDIEKQFNTELRKAVNDFSIALLENGDKIDDNMKHSAEILIDKILHHVVGKRYIDKKRSILDYILSIFVNKSKKDS